MRAGPSPVVVVTSRRPGPQAATGSVDTPAGTPCAARIAAQLSSAAFGGPGCKPPAAGARAWQLEQVTATAPDPSAMRARTRPPVPVGSSTQRPYRAAACREVSATLMYD